ncbi:MAG: HAD-IIA family hydrolase, partial [Anaerolineales bacterium]|nr:HAD-IIA family hydrolase [Anaerolineales bacterium]
PTQTVMNWRWEQGLSTSVQTGLMALPPSTDAAIFLQSDQPLLTPELLQALVHRYEETDAALVCPAHEGQRYGPALFAQRLFAELSSLTGDVGGRALFASHALEAATVEIADPRLLADVDTPADYETLAAQAAALLSPVTEPAGASALAPNDAAVARVLDPIRHLIVDMDGVLWHGNEPLPGLGEFFSLLREREIDFILATNNSSLMPEQYVAKLARFGVEVSPSNVLTSAQATAAYLKTVAPSGTRIYPVGGDGVSHALTMEGFEIGEEGAQYVVVGWDQQLTWKKMATAALLIHYGAGFIGTNPDTNYPNERGPVPGNGAQLAMLQTTTGVAPLVVGKPEPWMYREAMRRMGARAETTAVIGDRLDTDIVGGVPLGLTTVLVLSGIATAEALAHSSIKPDLVLSGIDELVRWWRELG